MFFYKAGRVGINGLAPVAVGVEFDRAGFV